MFNDMMNPYVIIFTGFSALLLGAALMTVISRNPVRSALFLVLSFFAASGLWILLTAEFLGLILILVYVGAVMTLFLFVVMTTQATDSRSSFTRYWPLVVLLTFVFLCFIVVAVGLVNTPTMVGLVDTSIITHNTEALGSVLYTQYAYPFEMMGFLLLVAIIAAISLNPRIQKDARRQKISEQVNVTPQDRIRIIKMKSSTPS
jgi:NADH-quinone oxidoreductase subunit J